MGANVSKIRTFYMETYEIGCWFTCQHYAQLSIHIDITFVPLDCLPICGCWIPVPFWPPQFGLYANVICIFMIRCNIMVDCAYELSESFVVSKVRV